MESGRPPDSLRIVAPSLEGDRIPYGHICPRLAVLFVFSLFAPYLAFAVADSLGASGVLAVVVAGFVATRRLEVSREVRRAVWQAAATELLRLRDRGEINDRDHQDLQLELDREYADLVTV